MSAAATSAVPRLLAFATLLAAVPLVVFGGTVTTMDAGMAVDGWLVVEPGRGDHFLLFYPLEKWFRDAGTFVEHTHRLLGSLVGALAIATVVAALLKGRGAGARAWPVVALVAVCAQGAVGGFRVLENSPNLAFLHGVLGQAVFAVLGLSYLAQRPAWHAAPSGVPSAPVRLAWVATGLLFAQIFVGAWWRHGAPVHPAIELHGLGALVVVGVLMVLAKKLKPLAAAAPALRGPRLRMVAYVHTQLLIGIATFVVVYVVVGPQQSEVHQTVFPTLHVLFGALLLLETATVAMWCTRIAARGGAPAPAALRGAPAAEGARG